MRAILLSILICLSVSSLSAQIFVKSTASGAQNGSSWADAYSDLQLAIFNASAGDTIWVAAGSYIPSIDTLGNLPGTNERRTFWLKNGVVIYGGFIGNETSLSQRDPVNMKAVLEGELAVGGPFAENVITVYASIDSTAVLDGFFVQDGKSMVTSTSKNGSGMLLRGDARFSNIRFRYNETYNQGGAVYAEYSSSRFVACSFEYNSTIQYDGGALNAVYSDIKMYNCVFVKNEATRFGGAITTVESDLLVQNGTFTENTGGTNMFQFSTSGTINLYNCIFTASNVAPSVLGTSGGVANFRESLMPQDNNWLILCPSCIAGTPVFVDDVNLDFGLVAGSPGIDETLVTAPLNNYNDYMGNPRLVGSSMDLGAYENQGLVSVTAPVSSSSLTAYPSPTTGMLSIQSSETIQNIAIYNTNGQLVQVEASSAFSVESLPAGLYVVHATTENGAATTRFVKK